MEQIKLDMIPKGITPIAHASQYDQGRLIHFILMDNLQAFILTDETVTIKVCKPDNNIVTAEATYTANTNIVTITTTEQMTAVAGDSKCEISITKNNIKIGSLNFILRVEADPLKDGVESETVIANLDTIIDNAVSEALNDTVLYGAYPTAEIDNVPIASFSDGADDVPVKALQIGIEATQEGTGDPSPSNVRNIVGFTGANISVVGSNLFDEVMELGSINNSTGQNETASNVLRSTNYIQIKSNTTYKITQGSYVYAFFYYDASKTFISYASGSSTFTTPANACYMRFRLYSAYGTTYNNDIAILYPSSLNSYVAYNANSTTTAISWQSEAGTVYGGSLDVTTGVLTVTWHAIDLGSLTWTYDAESVPSNPYFFCQRDTVKVSTQNLLCSIYQLANVGVANMPNYSMKSNNKGQVLIVNNDYSDKDIFKTAMSGVLLVCEKLTPETYQLDSVTVKSILGDNNIFADTGDIQNLIYRRDMNSIVEAIPAPPSENGTYSLKCTVSGGVASYSWVAD